MATKIEVNHQAVTMALNKLAGQLDSMRPFLLDDGQLEPTEAAWAIERLSEYLME